jgi:ornithine cyclodeaminase/alanine dehydrogenase-like protein (mu-crystallin family)
MDTSTKSGNTRAPSGSGALAPASTLLLTRSDVERLLTLEECIAAVEDAFRLHATGKAGPLGVLGIHVEGGSFHVKAAALALDRPYFAAKLNANFPENGSRHGLPTIQGLLALCDASSGTPLAVMDSMAITALRTAAATAVAAKYLAREHCDTALICGCGGQAPTQARALCMVRKPRRIYAYDQDAAKATAFAVRMGAELSIAVTPVGDLTQAVGASDIVITCTTARRFFIARSMVKPGAFIAAVGADNECKQEIDPRLLAEVTVVVDLLEQCCAIGDLHHAIAAGLMVHGDVHAQLGEVIAGLRPGRSRDDEIIVFDSSGTALQDVAAAAAVYRRALGQQQGVHFSFNV